MRRSVLAGLISLVFMQGFGQTVTISSRAVDRDTKEPLPFASVGIKGYPIGTITNLDGEFDFHFPAAYARETFVISMLGYLNFEVPASSLLQSKAAEILLEKSTTVLKTVVVSDTLTGGDIVRIALMRLESNHPDKPYLMDAFYRDLKKIGDSYVSLLEAAIRIHDENFREPRNKFKLRERVQLIEVRRSIGYSNRFTSYFDEDNLLEEVLLHNNIRYRQFPVEDIFFESLSRKKNTTYDDHEVFVVTYNQEFRLTLFIDVKTFGMLHMEYENNTVQPINKKRGLISKFVGIKKTIDYKYYQGKLYLNYMEVLSKINWYDLNTDRLRFETELAQHLLINQVFPETEERIGITAKMRRYGLQYQDQPYNKPFWDSYNVIKDSPLDRKIIADLERDGPVSYTHLTLPTNREV